MSNLEMTAKIFFSERLRELRAASGLSQRQMAEIFEVTKVGYQNYEYGRNMPSFEMLSKLADFFNVSIDYLLGRTDEPHLPTKEEWAILKQLRERKAIQPSEPDAICVDKCKSRSDS